MVHRRTQRLGLDQRWRKTYSAKSRTVQPTAAKNAAKRFFIAKSRSQFLMPTKPKNLITDSISGVYNATLGGWKAHSFAIKRKYHNKTGKGLIVLELESLKLTRSVHKETKLRNADARRPSRRNLGHNDVSTYFPFILVTQCSWTAPSPVEKGHYARSFRTTDGFHINFKINSTETRKPFPGQYAYYFEHSHNYSSTRHAAHIQIFVNPLNRKLTVFPCRSHMYVSPAKVSMIIPGNNSLEPIYRSVARCTTPKKLQHDHI